VANPNQYFMREAAFIDKNNQRWHDIEHFTKDDPDEVASDFIDLVTDLSYAQTHYPHSRITNYINFLAARVYKSIFTNKEKNPILDYWKRDFPLIIGHNIKVLWVAVSFFFTFSILGYVCSFIDTNFIESVLGSGYVEMTESNIRKGMPFGVYEDADKMTMFLRIFANNLFVGLLIFISGIFVGIGTFYHTFKNGLMVGTFMAMFFKHHLGVQAIFVIMLHGTLELMGLILECMAGLILGLSFLFPGTLTRMQSLKKGLLESSKIYIGTIPFTILAAFIESYVTHLGKSGFNNANALIMGLLVIVFIGSWIFVVWYFFIYSKKVALNIPLEEYYKETVK
jgi:uncharacterized membrane protein SpoIIM required for sporulation